jgi:hypothetical protein
VSSGKKVREVSMRLMERTEAYENAKWKGPENVIPATKIPAPLPAEVQERLLEPTAAYEKSKYTKVSVVTDPREAAWITYASKAKSTDVEEPGMYLVLGKQIRLQISCD